MNAERREFAKKVYRGMGVAVSALFSLGLAQDLLRTHFWDVRRVNVGEFATAGLVCFLRSVIPGITVGLTWPVSLPWIYLHCLQMNNPLYMVGLPPDNLFPPEG